MLLKAKEVGKMSKFRNFLFETMEKIRTGETPNKTAEQIHKTGHRVVMDKFADVKMSEIGIRDQELKDSMKAMDSVKAK